MNTNQKLFAQKYAVNLAEHKAKNPELYFWEPHASLDDVVDRMVKAMARGSAGVNTPTIRKTCRQLGIKPTITAIKEFLR